MRGKQIFALHVCLNLCTLLGNFAQIKIKIRMIFFVQIPSCSYKKKYVCVIPGSTL